MWNSKTKTSPETEHESRSESRERVHIPPPSINPKERRGNGKRQSEREKTMLPSGGTEIADSGFPVDTVQDTYVVHRDFYNKFGDDFDDDNWS